MTTFTDWDIIRNLLLAGRWTVLLSLVAFTGGALVTLPLLLLRLTGGRQVKRLIRGYIELFQGTPLLMQLFLAFFGVALFGVDVSAWTAASVALTLYTSAFLLDIWFGSIRALPKGQWEASRCLGLSFGQTLYRVVAAISRQNADKAPVPSFMLKDSPCFIGLKKNEPALKAKVDTLIEQGIKDGTLNGLSEKWLKAPLPASLGA
ncbi:amino acid ABC transporter [Klebsiella pneumoniae]|nr:amino acid ABC transporter [Klebsiella pneumoniae]